MLGINFTPSDFRNKRVQGNVEVWLKSLLDMVRSTVHSVIRKAASAIADTSSFKLIEFENVFPAQVGLLGIQMLWTRDAEVALGNAKSDKKVNAACFYFTQFFSILSVFGGLR